MTFQIIFSSIYLISLSECVVMNVPMMTDDIDVENTNTISVKVQGNNAESKKTFQVLKVNHFLDDFRSNSLTGVSWHKYTPWYNIELILFFSSQTEPLDKLMTAYCKFRKLPHSRLKFLFDGDEIRGTETPIDLEMEDDDVIDVRDK